MWARTVMWVGGAAVLAVSAASYHLLEMPVRQWAKGRRAAPSAAAPAVAPPVLPLPLPFPQPARRAA